MNDAARTPENSADVVYEGRGLVCIRGERIVFSGLSFGLTKGEALVLLGRNGSGKSSLLRLMAGLLPPAAGDFTLHGLSQSADREIFGHHIRYLGHHDAIKPVLSVAENLAFWARVYGEAGADIEARVARAMEAFDLMRLKDVPGIMLSAGQKRRTNLARLLVAPSDLWLLDEPTTALDKGSVKVFEQVVRDFRAEGGIVVLSTHLDLDLDDPQELYMENFAAAPAGAARHVHFAADLFADDEDEV